MTTDELDLTPRPRLRGVGALVIAVSSVVAVLSACDDPVPVGDGGADASSFDAGRDAGPRDAGRDAYRPPIDAGPQWTDGDPPEVAWVLPDCAVARGVLAREVQRLTHSYTGLHGFDVRDGRASLTSMTESAGIVWHTVSPTEVIEEIVPDGISPADGVVIHEGTPRLLASVPRRRDDDLVISTVGVDPREVLVVAGGGITFYGTRYGGRIESAGAHIDLLGTMWGPSVPPDTMIGWLMFDGDGEQVGTVRQLLPTPLSGLDPTVLFDPVLRRGVVLDYTLEAVYVTPFTETTAGPRRVIVDDPYLPSSGQVGVIAGDVVAIVFLVYTHPDAFFPVEYYTEVSITTGEVLVPPRRWSEDVRAPYPMVRFVSRPDGRVDVLRLEQYSAIDRDVYNASQPLTVDLGRTLPIAVSPSDPSSLRVGGGGEVRDVLAERDGEDLYVFWNEVGPCMEGEFEDRFDRPCVHNALWAILRCDE